MDELHTLALEVARRILESADEDPASVELARALLAEVEKNSAPVRATPTRNSGQPAGQS